MKFQPLYVNLSVLCHGVNSHPLKKTKYMVSVEIALTGNDLQRQLSQLIPGLKRRPICLQCCLLADPCTVF